MRLDVPPPYQARPRGRRNDPGAQPSRAALARRLPFAPGPGVHDRCDPSAIRGHPRMPFMR